MAWGFLVVSADTPFMLLGLARQRGNKTGAGAYLGLARKPPGLGLGFSRFLIYVGSIFSNKSGLAERKQARINPDLLVQGRGSRGMVVETKIRGSWGL